MKKLICFSVVLVLGALVEFAGETKAAPQLRSGSSTDTCYAAGDINGNRLGMELSDLVLAIRVLTCEAPVPDSLYRMDVNGDCNVNQYDLDLILYFIQYGPSVLPGYSRATCCNPDFDSHPAGGQRGPGPGRRAFLGGCGFDFELHFYRDGRKLQFLPDRYEL